MKALTTSAWKLGGVAISAALVGIAIYGKRTAPTASQSPSDLPAPPTEETRPAPPTQQSSHDTRLEKSSVVQQVATASTLQSQSPESLWRTGQAVDILVSPATTYSQRQAIWKGLKEPEQLDRAIADLEQRIKNDPQSLIAPPCSALLI